MRRTAGYSRLNYKKTLDVLKELDTKKIVNSYKIRDLNGRNMRVLRLSRR
jgi:hypothetical protein